MYQTVPAKKSAQAFQGSYGVRTYRTPAARAAAMKLMKPQLGGRFHFTTFIEGNPEARARGCWFSLLYCEEIFPSTAYPEA